MIACSANATVSLTSQGLIDVARDARLVGPTSLFFNTVAVSGERKTSSDHHFCKPIRDWETARSEQMEPSAAQRKAELDAWQAERDGLLAKIKSASGRFNKPTDKNPEKSTDKKTVSEEVDIQALKDSVTKLEETKPAAVIIPRLFYEDVNAETLAVDLSRGWPSASLWSDEAGLVIGSSGMSDDNLMKFIALLNRLWDGIPFRRDRLTTRSARLKGRRFTLSLMEQPIVMARLLSACGGAARGMGFMARTLQAWPRSTIGTRPYREPPADMPKANAFYARITELLDTDLLTEGPTMALAPPHLRLSHDAKQEWVAFFNSIESELKRSGEFGDLQDVGSKIAENAARMGGNFHVLEQGLFGEISKKLITGARSVVAWHLDEARRIIRANRRQPEEIADAELLFGWLCKQATPIEPRAILRLGPAPLRDKKRRDAALAILLEKNWVFETDRPTRLLINPKAKTP